MKRLAYILLMMFLVAAQAAAQDVNVVDVVCQKSERTYRIDGEEDSVWEWKLEFEEADGTITEVVPMLFEANGFSEERNGDYIWGSEITILWDLSSGSLDPGIYNLSVEQTSIHGCINHQFGQIEVIPAPTAFAGNDTTVCATDVVFLENATATNYSNVLWSTDPESGGTFSDPEALNPTYFPGGKDIENGEVELWLVALSESPTDGCDPAVSTIKITLINLTAGITADPPEVCEGNPVQLYGNPGGNSTNFVSHEWTGEPEHLEYLSAVDISDPEFSAEAPPGTYTFTYTVTYTVTDENRCVASDEITIEVYELPLVDTMEDKEACDSYILPSLIHGSYFAQPGGIDPIDEGEEITETTTLYVFAGNPDDPSCSAQNRFTITINLSPLLVINNPDPVCAPDSIDLTLPEITEGTDGDDLIFTYWKDLEMTEIIENPEAVSESGIYYICVEDQNKCYKVMPVEVIIHPKPELPDFDIIQPDCEVQTGAIEVTAPLGEDYSYSIDGENFQTETTFDNLAPGEYTVTVMGENDCTAEMDITIEKAPEIVSVSVSIEADKIRVCEGEEVTFTAIPENGGDNPVYRWFVNDEEDENETGDIFKYTPADGDKIYVELTSDEICVVDATVESDRITIEVVDELVVEVSIEADKIRACEGEEVTFTAIPENGGDNPAYRWFVNDEEVGNDNTYTYKPANGDKIYVELTSDEICVVDATVESDRITIEVVDELVVEVSIEADKIRVCEGEEVTFTAIPENGGNNPAYRWFVNDEEDENETGHIFKYTPADGDKIYVELTSDLACVSNNPATSSPEIITVEPMLTVSVSIISDPAGAEVNEGESITFTANPVNGGSSPVYEWFVNGKPVPDIDAVSFNYIPEDGDVVYATLTSSESCAEPVPAFSNEITVTVLTGPGKLDITASITHPDCFGDPTGAIALTVSGGSGNYEYLWNNGETTKDISELPAGTYTVTVTDTENDGLTATGSWEVSSPDDFVLEFSKVNVGYSPDPIGSITITTLTGGTLSYSYFWEGPDGFTATTRNLENLYPGQYILTVTDRNGCIVTGTINIESKSADYTFACPPDIAVECRSDVPPRYNNLSAFLAAGGVAESDCELIPGSFSMTAEVSNNRSCPETITRTYTLTDDCGNKMECYQTITVHDKTKPVFDHRLATNRGSSLTLPKTVFCVGDVPAPFPDGEAGYNRFIAEIGSNNPNFVTDNCGIDKSRFMFYSQTPKVPDCDNMIVRVYYIFDHCMNYAEFKQNINIIPLSVTGCPDDIALDGNLSDLQSLTGFAYSETPKSIPVASARNLGIAIEYDCKLASLTYSDEADGNCPIVVKRTFTASDGCTTVQCVQTITLTPEYQPEFAPITQICLNGNAPDLLAVSLNGIRGSWNPAVIETGTVGDKTYTFTPDEEQCAAATTLTIRVVDEIEPEFAPIGPICLNGTAPKLPDKSLNDISGSWTPATIPTNVADIVILTFTPDAGQCALTTTLTVQVVDEIEPEFDPIGPVCLNGTAPELQDKSLNDISGSWSPATIPTNVADKITLTFTPDAGQCALTTTLTVQVVDEIEPEFDPIGPICLNGTAPKLQDKSLNDISGSWSPATIPTNVADIVTLTFTPDAGQCASIATLTVEIVDEIQPEFVVTGPFCQGEKPEELPMVSDNGVPGNWSPAVIDTETSGTFEYTFTPDLSVSPCAVPVSVEIEILPQIQPEFDIPQTLCVGDAAPSLADKDKNGIGGTWNPQTIDTSTQNRTEYTFTPDESYPCAVPYSVTVRVEPRIQPVFDAIGPLCLGDMPPTLPLSDNNGISGTWKPDAIDTGTPGTRTYIFTPDETGACAEVFRLMVEVVDKVLPIAENRTLTAQVNKPVMGNISGYVKNPSPSAPIRVTITEKPVFGSVSVDESTGKFTYTPEHDFTGADELTYEFCYDSGPCGWLCDKAKIIINVKLPNRPPVAEDSYFTVICVPLYEYFSASDPDGDKLRFNPFFVDSPRHGIAMVLGDNDGYFSYEPDLEFVGEDSLTFRVCDTGGLCDEATVYFKVLPRVDCDGLPGGEDQPDTECSLFIPEGFSPNGDGVHDFFQVYCIEKYPDAILRVFDRSGSKIFQKHHYGNLDYWGTDENAWWWGTAESRWVISRGTLPAGTYLYVLELGNGEVRTGTVMIAY